MAPDEPRVRSSSLVHRGLGRVEFMDLLAGELDGLEGTLQALAREGRRRFSFHAPIVRPDYFPYSGVTCFFLCEDDARRALSFRLLEDTLARAARHGADYAVTHLTFGPSDTRDEATALRLAQEAATRFAELSAAHGVRLDVEFAAYTGALHQPERFVDVVGRHPELGVCLDVGHTYIGALARGRDYLADVRTLAPAARSMHLWNTKGPDHRERHGHVPLHPRQRPEDGWIDIEGTLAVCLREHRPLDIVFEYPVDVVTDDVQEGYAWIANLVGHEA